MTNEIQNYVDEMVADRRHLHQNPEEGWYGKF